MQMLNPRYNICFLFFLVKFVKKMTLMSFTIKGTIVIFITWKSVQQK